MYSLKNSKISIHESITWLEKQNIARPMKILDNLSRGNFSCVSKKPDTYNETGIYKIKIIHITKAVFTLQKILGYCRAVPQVYSSISC